MSDDGGDGIDWGDIAGVPDWVTEITAAGGGTLVAISNNPVEWLESNLYDILVAPIIGFIVDAWGVLFDSLLWVAFGHDKEPYLHPLNATDAGIGLLDLPLYLVALLEQQLQIAIAAPILRLIDTIGQEIRFVAASAGPAAPIVVPVLWLAFAGAVVWSAWWVLYTIDVPLVDQGPTLDALSAPARKLVGWIGR